MQSIIRLRKKQGITERQEFIRRQLHWQQQSQISDLASQEQHDPLWDQTPEMGLEGIVATFRSKKKLQAALVNQQRKRRPQQVS
jgi:hypothetical protein